MNVYVIAVLVIVTVIGFAISYTFLFNISEIKVSGESDMYSAEQIVEASGIKEGDNLLRTDTKQSEIQILQQLLYIETVDVKRDFPFSLEINVTSCIPSYNVNCGSKTLLISKKGKILASNSFITDGLPTIYGFLPDERTPGEYISSEDEFKSDAFNAIIESIGRLEEPNISSLNMQDEHSIVVNYKNGMVFKMGNWSDSDYKFSLAETVMNDSSIKGKKGYLTMIGRNQCSFRTTDKPVGVPGKNSTDDKKKTDSKGNTVKTPEPAGESNPDQEAIFSDYNNREDSGEEFFNWENQETTEKASDENGGYYDENGIYHDQYGGYYDSWGTYHDQYGGYYDEYGNYYDSYGNLVQSAWNNETDYGQGW